MLKICPTKSDRHFDTVVIKVSASSFVNCEVLGRLRLSTKLILALALGSLANEYVFISFASHETLFLDKRLKMMNHVPAVIS